jgi:hypothetical protein
MKARPWPSTSHVGWPLWPGSPMEHCVVQRAGSTLWGGGCMGAGQAGGRGLMGGAGVCGTWCGGRRGAGRSAAAPLAARLRRLNPP